MTTATLQSPESATSTDRKEQLVRAWLRGLGDVPVERIMLDPPPGTATEADFLRFNDGDQKVPCELVNRTLVIKTMGQFESVIASVLNAALWNWQKEHMPGYVSGEQSMLRMPVGNVRMPDVAFYPKSQFPDGRFPRDKIADYPALLAVEVLSESNTVAELSGKIREYFDSGTKLIWVVDPEPQTVRIYDRPDKPDAFRQLARTDTLDGGDVLPSFSVPVATLFDV